MVKTNKQKKGGEFVYSNGKFAVDIPSKRDTRLTSFKQWKKNMIEAFEECDKNDDLSKTDEEILDDVKEFINTVSQNRPDAHNGEVKYQRIENYLPDYEEPVESVVKMSLFRHFSEYPGLTKAYGYSQFKWT